jgi:nucleotide-binding universal stress UspA family protein
VIIVGVDGSAVSKETLRFALEEARRRRTDLHVVHAFWEWEPIPGTREIELDRSPQERETWLAALVHEVVGEVTDVEIRQSTVDDDPAPALLAAAQGAELLIVGSRGKGGFAGLLLGSVSQQCVHHASCPVVVVRGRNGHDMPDPFGATRY